MEVEEWSWSANSPLSWQDHQLKNLEKESIAVAAQVQYPMRRDLDNHLHLHKMRARGQYCPSINRRKLYVQIYSFMQVVQRWTFEPCSVQKNHQVELALCHRDAVLTLVASTLTPTSVGQVGSNFSRDVTTPRAAKLRGLRTFLAISKWRLNTHRLRCSVPGSRFGSEELVRCLGLVSLIDILSLSMASRMMRN